MKQDIQRDSHEGISISVTGKIPQETLDLLVKRNQRPDLRPQIIALVLVMSGGVGIVASVMGYLGTDIGVLGAVISLAGIAVAGLAPRG